MNHKLKPELLLPAGNLDKALTALRYGADAIYMGGKAYSLRAKADNFDSETLGEAVRILHQHMGKVYVTVNIFAHQRDLLAMPEYLESLQEIRVDGLIISDLGVLRLANRYAPEIPITVSTQANTTNVQAALVYRDLGAKRIVLARELSLEEIYQIKAESGLEIEVFVHGAMCMAYSGRCLLSHYMTGRSANLGECAHPCRYKYFLYEETRPQQTYSLEEDERGSYLMNSKDLCLLQALPDLIAAGVDSFKVEGRMKSQLYVASVGSVYRQAIDAWQEDPSQFSNLLTAWQEELLKTATRPFTSGFFYSRQEDMEDRNKEVLAQSTEFAGVVTNYDEISHTVTVEQKSNFGPGDKLEFFLPGLLRLPVDLNVIWNQKGEPVDRARHPQEKISFFWPEPIENGTILRKEGGKR